MNGGCHTPPHPPIGTPLLVFPKIVWKIGKTLNVNLANDDVDDTDWVEIHIRNFRCSIDTRLRSFCFKFFHKAIAFYDFLFKINRKNSPNSDFCDKYPESVTHIFCDCDLVWDELFQDY